MVTNALRQQASDAFHAYEKVVIERIARRPGWRLDASPLYAVLATEDDAKILGFIEEMRLGKLGLEDAVIV